MIYFLKDGYVWQIILERECKSACTDSKLGPENSHSNLSCIVGISTSPQSFLKLTLLVARMFPQEQSAPTPSAWHSSTGGFSKYQLHNLEKGF